MCQAIRIPRVIGDLIFYGIRSNVFIVIDNIVEYSQTFVPQNEIYKIIGVSLQIYRGGKMLILTSNIF